MIFHNCLLIIHHFYLYNCLNLTKLLGGVLLKIDVSAQKHHQDIFTKHFFNVEKNSNRHEVRTDK